MDNRRYSITIHSDNVDFITRIVTLSEIVMRGEENELSLGNTVNAMSWLLEQLASNIRIYASDYQPEAEGAGAKTIVRQLRLTADLIEDTLLDGNIAPR